MSAYLDSELRRPALARFEHHTAECRECRGVFEELRVMIALLHRVPPPEVAFDGPALATAVLRRLHEPAER
jgi:anti-sigma factor RsiW